MEGLILADIIGGLSCVAAAGALGLYARSIWRHMGRVERVCVLSLATMFVLVAVRIFVDSTVVDGMCAVLMLPTIIGFLYTMKVVSDQQQKLRAELQNLKDYVASRPGPGETAADPKALEVTTERILRVIKSAG